MIVVIALLMGLSTLFMLRVYNHNNNSMKKSLLISLIPFLLFLLIGLALVSKNKKERFGLGSDGLDQNQTINIIQNCGSGPSPSPIPPGPSPVPTPLKSEDVLKWMNNINSKLTSTCQNCVVENALKLWNTDTLNKIETEPMEKQETILNAMLAFNCSKQCVITSSKLNAAEVDQWLHEADSSLSANCHQCAVGAILRTWSLDEYNLVLKMSEEKQKTVIQALIALNCAACNIASSLNKQEVQQWITGLLTGADVNCYACVLTNILKMWNNLEFAKVKAMDKASQIQILKALMSLNCDKECITIPSGLSSTEVSKWVFGLVKNMDLGTCVNSCIVPFIVRKWTPEMFNEVKNKSTIEQQKILQGVITMNCSNACFGGAMSQGEIEYVVSLVIPEANPACVACIAKEIAATVSPAEFHLLMSRPVFEQSKVFRTMASYKCPDLCKLTPVQECDFPFD